LNNGKDGRVLWVSGYVGSGNPTKGPYNQYIYNNTIYVKDDITSSFDIHDTNLGLLVANNIFYVEGPTKDDTGNSDDNYTQDMVDHVVWKNNLYQRTGIVPVFYEDSLSQPSFTETDPIIGDPLFANTGGLNASDYIPMSAERIQDKGIIIEKLPDDEIGLIVGLEVSEDFFGNTITGLPDMGAIQFGGTYWNGRPVDENGWTDTGTSLGWLNVRHAPWTWSPSYQKWMYLPESNLAQAGTWTYIPNPTVP
jgi:hypothetical protein